MLCSIPMYAALTRRWPEATVALVAAPTAYPVPLRELNPYLATVIEQRRSSLRSTLALVRAVRGLGADLAVVPSTVALSRTSHVLAWLSGAPVRVGVRSIDGKANPSARFLTVAVDVQWNADRVHQRERNLAFAAALGCATDDGDGAVDAFHPSDADRASAERLLMDVHARGRPLLGIHPGAGKTANLWPVARFVEVARRAFETARAAVVLTAGAVDRAVTDEALAGLRGLGIPHTAIENVPIGVLGAVAGSCDAYLCNDTGVMHVAAASGAAVVSLFGPTRAWEWAPRAARCIALQSPSDRMEDLPVDGVAVACLRAMGGPAAA
jgi:ADP-heptose:LPS heptosyltransferase